MKDYYQTLGVSRQATPEEIKKAYRRLARQYHPDMNKGDKKAEERFKDISEAYSVLSEADKRKQYDMFGGTPFGGGGAGGGAGQGGFKGYRWEQAPKGGFKFYRDAEGEEEGESFDFGGADLGNLGDVFADLFNMGGLKKGKQKWSYGGAQPGENRYEAKTGIDTYTTLEIDFMEAVYGTEARLQIKRSDKTEKITVKIPAGVDNGSKVRIAGKGEAGRFGGKDGDLYINIKVKPHPMFWREGADIYTEVPISVYESILGATIEVPTLDGHANMKVPSSTESGQKFRLKGKGAPIVGKRGTGDQYVMVKIVPPKKLDEKTRQVYEQLSRDSNYNPRED